MIETLQAHRPDFTLSSGDVDDDSVGAELLERISATWTHDGEERSANVVIPKGADEGERTRQTETLLAYCALCIEAEDAPQPET